MATADEAPAPKLPPPILAEVLAQHALTIELRDGALIGPGAAFLAQEAAASQFVLIGEDHGLAAMPRFTEAFFELIIPTGYQHLAVEIGPLVAAHLEQLAGRPDAQERFVAFNHAHPYGAAFYGWREEAEMMERVVKSMNGTAGASVTFAN